MACCGLRAAPILPSSTCRADSAPMQLGRGEQAAVNLLNAGSNGDFTSQTQGRAAYSPGHS